MKKVVIGLIILNCLCLMLPLMVKAEEMVDTRNEYEEEYNTNILSEGLQEILSKKDIAAVVFLCDTYDLKEEPGKESNGISLLKSGQTVWIEDVALDDEYNIWYKVAAYKNEERISGYIERNYLAYSDETLIDWEKSNIVVMEEKIFSENAIYNDVATFPSSYQQKLNELKKKHPNWIFVRMDVNIDWNEVVSNQIGERSLVPASSIDSWKNGSYSSGWAYATEGIIKYCMDPRNSLTENTIFQFEQLTYNASYHTAEAVQAVVSNTFMSGVIPDDSRTYAQAFWEIGNQLGVSPFHLSGRVYQEQGQGTSPLISGVYPGYEGLYNYFNISASGTTNAEIFANGLNKARQEGWNTRYKSLLGGAKTISSGYILKGQDTIYLQKFDVDSTNGLYWHQYMQNICAPQSEAGIVKKAYVNAGALENTFVFKIPVYVNMPSTACVKPGETVPVNEERVRAFVSRLYRVTLGREADKNGFDYWTGELVSKAKTGAVVAKGFVLSDEMNRRNLSDEQFVTIMYQTFFDRTPADNDSGKAFWINLLENGVSRAYVFRGFCHSQEFTKICEDYGINRGEITLNENKDQKHNLTMYVYRCYDRVLGRTPDEKGLNYWTGEMLSGNKTATKVAEQFIFSKEFLEKNVTDEEFVKILYRAFMDREADSNGLSFWINELVSGNRSRKEVMIGFANSKEFKLIKDTFGVK